MELLEIQSRHDLTAHLPEARRPGTRSYHVSCRQFMSVLSNSRRAARARLPSPAAQTLGFMTLAADQIWVTDEEIGEIVAAIESSRSRVALG